jgi:hypothetical protein
MKEKTANNTSVGKSTGRSKTGKPLDKIDLNPQHKLDNVKLQREDAVDLPSPPIEEGKALTIAQRQKRARVMKRLEPKLARKRDIARKRIAPKEALQRRAEVAAREILKKRFSGMKGVPYAELSVAQKIQVDKRLEGKVALIKRLAARLLPTIRRKEFERLSSYYHGKKMDSMHSSPVQTESFNAEFQEFFSQFLNKEDQSSIQEMAHEYTPETLINVIESMIADLGDDHPFKDTLTEMLDKVAPINPIHEALQKKSDQSGLSLETVKTIFERGFAAWDGKTQTQEQYAFARVNSYIAGGKAYELDSDLHEAKKKKKSSCGMNKAFEDFVKEEVWDKPSPAKKPKTLSVFWKEKAKARARNAGRPYPNMIDNMWAAQQSKKQAEETQPTATVMNESFVMDRVAGIGQMVTAADAGIEIKAGFVNYPGVEDLSQLLQMESNIKHRFENFINEEKDEEGGMAKGELMSMIKKAQALASKMTDDKQLDAWVQSKITKAADYINSVHDYLMNNKQEVDE